MTRPTAIRIAAIGLVAACVGCPGSLEDPSRFSDAAGPCPDVPTAIFGTVCSAPGCHSAVDKMLGLDLQSPDVASRLIGVPAMGGPGQLLIDPADPAKSAIYTKLTTAFPFGARMPFSKPPLDDATIACVLDWITAQVADGGIEDAGPASEASGDDGPASDDSSSPMSGGDATTQDAAPRDAGSGQDARTIPKEASAPPVDASVKDSSAPPADANGD